MGAKDKWKKDELKLYRITNDDLTCRNCKFRKDDSEVLGNTSRCEKFRIKTRQVLDGGECDEKEVEQ